MNEESKVAVLEAKVDAHGRELGEIKGEIREIKAEQKAIYKIATSVELIAEHVNRIEEKVDDTNRKVDVQTKAWQDTEMKLSEKINETSQRPYKRVFENMNSIKMAIITTICSAIVGGLVAALVSFSR